MSTLVQRQGGADGTCRAAHATSPPRLQPPTHSANAAHAGTEQATLGLEQFSATLLSAMTTAEAEAAHPRCLHSTAPSLLHWFLRNFLELARKNPAQTPCDGQRRLSYSAHS